MLLLLKANNKAGYVDVLLFNDGRPKPYQARVMRGSKRVRLVYGDSMILAVCIFSQSATGEVSCAYFRKLAISRGGECKFSQTGPNARLQYARTVTR